VAAAAAAVLPNLEELPTAEISAELQRWLRS